MFVGFVGCCAVCGALFAIDGVTVPATWEPRCEVHVDLEAAANADLDELEAHLDAEHLRRQLEEECNAA